MANKQIELELLVQKIQFNTNRREILQRSLRDMTRRQKVSKETQEKGKTVC